MCRALYYQLLAISRISAITLITSVSVNVGWCRSHSSPAGSSQRPRGGGGTPVGCCKCSQRQGPVSPAPGCTGWFSAAGASTAGAAGAGCQRPRQRRYDSFALGRVKRFIPHPPTTPLSPTSSLTAVPCHAIPVHSGSEYIGHHIFVPLPFQ